MRSLNARSECCALPSWSYVTHKLSGERTEGKLLRGRTVWGQTSGWLDLDGVVSSENETWKGDIFVRKNTKCMAEFRKHWIISI